jgi:hypothetical protein
MRAMRRFSRLRLVIPTVFGLAGIPGGPSPAAAQSLADYDYEHLTFRALGVGAGYLWSDRIRDTEAYNLRIDLGYLGPGVRIVPSLGYWRSTLEQAELDSLAARLAIPPARLGVIEWSDISLAVDGHFVWSVPFGVLTFIGVGLGLHALNGQGEAVDGTFIEALLDDITAGVNGIAGFEIEPINRIRIYAEGRYTAMSSLRYVTARGGVQIMFSRGNVQVGAVAPPPPPGRPGSAR